MRGRTICAVGVLCLLVASERDVATQRAWQGTASELQEAALFARPAIMAEPGFTATLVVAPGDELEDPLGLVPHDDGTVWIVDDGGVALGDRGGYVWSIDGRGQVTQLVEPSRMMPSTGFDVAPAGFGQWGGQILTLSTPTAARIGVQQSHIIERIDPRSRERSTTICTLPNHGSVNGGVPSAGIEARFGPPGTPFADRFFSITIGNNTIYQTTADGMCSPFATFDGGPWGLAFSPDGSRVLVAVREGALREPPAPSAKARIVSVTADGVVDGTVYEHSGNALFDVEVAPASFGAYGGQVFFTDWGAGPGTSVDQPPRWDGVLYRIAPDGTAQVVASGFSSPSGIGFAGNSIWVSDINRDGPFFLTGNTADPENQWVPDGFLVRIALEEAR